MLGADAPPTTANAVASYLFGRHTGRTSFLQPAIERGRAVGLSRGQVDTEANLPSSTVTSVAQTPDGYLWVGTYNGLARFDGARFVTFDPVNKPELTQARVQGLFLDVSGTLWVNTFKGGLTSYRNGVWRNEWPDQPTYDLHTTLAASTSNLVTFVTQYGEVVRHDLTKPDAKWEIYSPPGVRALFQCTDNQGRLWFLTQGDNHICSLRTGASSCCG